MRRVLVKDLIALSKDGEWGKGEPFDGSVEMLCIRGTDFKSVRGGLIDSVPRRHIAGRHAEKKTLQPLDLLIETAGGTKGQITGRTILLGPGLFERVDLPVTCASFSRFVRLRADMCDPAFVFWYFQYLYTAGFMHAYHTQHTGVARFQWTTFSASQALELPDLPVQRRLADILSAYDDLIVNGLRRIQILEEIAKRIYREWFVQFRFPGHEGVRRVDSSLGSIPSGWSITTFTDVADVLSGGTPKTGLAEYWGGEIPFFTPRDAPNSYYVHRTEKTITDAGLQNCASEHYPAETIFITARGTVGKIALAGVPMAMNQSCYALRGRDGVPQRLLFQLLREQVAHLKTNTGGATFDTIIVDTFRRMLVLRPPHVLMDLYAAATDSMYLQIELLQRQIRNLRATRDLLLPRLMSGQLTLPEAEEAAASSL